MNTLLSLALSAALAISLTACGGNANSSASQNNTSGSISENTQIPNPWTEYASLAEAQAAAGFDLTLPALSADFTQSAFQVLPGEETILQVNFWTEDDARQLNIRKAPGAQDISGDYNTYSVDETVSVDGVDVTVKGNEDGYHLAIWTANGYTYAISSDAALTQDALTQLAAAVH